MQTNNEIREKHEISSFMRNYGLDDDDTLNMEDTQQLLENYFDYLVVKLQERDAQIMEEIERLIPDSIPGVSVVALTTSARRQALLDVIALLQNPQ